MAEPSASVEPSAFVGLLVPVRLGGLGRGEGGEGDKDYVF